MGGLDFARDVIRGCATQPLQRGTRGIAMLRRDMARDQADCGGEHGGIVGETEHRQHVRNEIERQDEVGDGAQKRALHVARRLLVERTVIGCEQVLGEGKLRYYPLEFDPEAPAHTFAVFGQPVGRLKTHGMFSCHCPGSRKASAADRRTGIDKMGASRFPCKPPDQATPSWLAIAFIAAASSMSRIVTPPASWVASTTSTVL